MGSCRGRGRRDLGRERGVVDTVEFGGWAERRRVTGTSPAYTFQVMPLSRNISQGFLIRQVEFAVKKYRSHRHIPARVMMDLEVVNA